MNGSLKCVKNKGITCPALTCGDIERYRPVDMRVRARRY